MNKLYKDGVELMRGIYRFQEDTEVGNAILTYQGEITQDVVRVLTALIETNLARINESELVIGRVYHIMIEALQNIMRHGYRANDANERYQRSGILLREFSDCYVITTGNLVTNADYNKVSSKIDELNDMDKKALRKLHMESVYNAEISDRGGAGLGLIEMIRKSGGPVEYTREETNGEVSYMLLSFNIKK